jgi:hypothetical protein
MSYIDRTNVGMLSLMMSIVKTPFSDHSSGNAKLFGAIPDMGMTGQDWNTALSVFFVTYAAGGV